MKHVNASKKYCSRYCAPSYIRKMQNLRKPAEFSNATRGAISEWVVAIDLLLKGYEVFHAMSPASSCDLLALKNGTVLRIEVRTGQKTKRGISYSKRRFKADQWAVVVDNQVSYIPLLS